MDELGSPNIRLLFEFELGIGCPHLVCNPLIGAQSFEHCLSPKCSMEMGNLVSIKLREEDSTSYKTKLQVGRRYSRETRTKIEPQAVGEDNLNHKVTRNETSRMLDGVVRRTWTGASGARACQMSGGRKQVERVLLCSLEELRRCQ